ncbi:MAG: T9SS type A sorting domain-containing protein [Tannerella sp.]|nr:T9SS type A sorting domain-containing protein [Tannerella sp.]
MTLPHLEAGAQDGDIPAHSFTFTVPQGVNVYVGAKTGVHYQPFTEKQAVHTADAGGKTIFYYNVSGKHNYRISQSSALMHVGVFTPGAAATSLEFTAEQLALHHPKEIDRDANSLNGRNMADIFLNINAKGYLNLASGETHQIVNLRNWQAIDSDINNYFIEPDFHYTVINENGAADNSVVTVSPTGLLTAVSAGTAIVLVSYDAMMCAHTTNVGNNGAAFFGALWPENTGVFVVSVDAPAQTGITPNITINESLNTNEYDKMALAAVDAELDVFYYPKSNDGYDYTFRPAGVASVALAQPVLTEKQGFTTLQYSGFTTSGVTANNDGSYTLRLVHGRNIVKLISAAGTTEYQVLSAKPVTYALSNVSRPNARPRPGDAVAITFNTLYHPCNKQSGVYNMTAGIRYSSAGTDFGLMLGPGQYTFASKAQTLEVAIPADYPDKELVLTGGVIRVRGYGDHYGNHRHITLEKGKAPNQNAAVRDAYFGALPDIHIPLDDDNGIPSIPRNGIQVYPNPFATHITIETASNGKATLYNLSGGVLLTVPLKTGLNRIDATALPQGIYILRCGVHAVKVIKN